MMIDYALYNQTPAQHATPGSAEELAGCLGAASAAGLAVVPWGGGTRQHIGRPPARYDLALSTVRLNRVIEHTPADLVMTVEAGATLAAVQAELAQHGQWLPWDAPQPERASIGGLLASAAIGPLRLGYGAPRDWTLGMRVALADGRLVKSGAKVVKNVAGYDAHKLHLGALGTLGVIVEVTFKVAPLPARRRTLLAAFTDLLTPMRAMAALRAAPLQPVALIALNQLAEQMVAPMAPFRNGQPPHIVVATRFAGTSAAVERQVREATRRCVEAGARTIELSDQDDAPLWAALAEMTAPAGDGSLLVRAGAPPGAQHDLLRHVERATRTRNWPAARMLLAGIGLAYSRWQLDGATPASVGIALEELRDGLAAFGGYAVVEEAPPAMAGQIDHWGPAPEAITLMRTLRATWDPAGVLNPGRYVFPDH